LKNFIFTSEDQIWYIFDDQQSETLVIVTKNKEKATIAYHHVCLKTEQIKVLDIPLPTEIQWNICKVYNQKIIFQSPISINRPEQQYILVYDIAAKKIVLENYQRGIQTIVQQGIISYLLKIEPKKFDLLAFDKNEILQDLTIDPIGTDHLKLPTSTSANLLNIQHNAFDISATLNTAFHLKVSLNNAVIYEWEAAEIQDLRPENDYFMVIHNYLFILKEKNTIEIIELKA
jgi:hypothetical protein